MIGKMFGGLGRWLRHLLWRVTRTILVSLALGIVVLALDLFLNKDDEDGDEAEIDET